MRKSLIAAGAVALVLTAGACGKDDAGSATNAATPNAGNQTAPKPGADGATPAKPSGGLFSNAGGLADLVSQNTQKAKTSKVSMTMNMGPISMTGNGEEEYAGADTKIHMTEQAMGQSIEMIFIDRNIYMKLPTGGQAGKPWVKMSLDQLSKAGGGGDITKQMEQSDPSHMLDMLEKNGKILSKTPDQVDGQPATKYAVDVDIQKMLTSLGQKAPAGLNQSKIKSIPMNVWLNSDNLPLQIEMDMGGIMKQVAQSSGQKMPAGMDKAKMVAKYTDWGKPVNIQAPPANQVSSKQLPGMGGTGGTAPAPGASQAPSLPGGN